MELLTAEDLSTKLYKIFGVDVERVRSVLNKDALSQTGLESLAHYAIEITIETPSVETRKSIGADANGTSNKKKKQGEESTVSLFLFCFTKVKSTDMLHKYGLMSYCQFYWKMSVKLFVESGVFGFFR